MSIPQRVPLLIRRVVPLVVLGAAAIGVSAMLPPRTRDLPSAGALPLPVRGAIHVHTRRSDGAGTVDAIAAAAARSGLKFVIITDHGDATRPPDPPAYRAGVLCIDAVEISTESGHLVAIGLPRSPYPLGGEPRDALADVARLGGFSIVAHPTSDKESARWRDWDVPFGGVEWLNGDSEWRDESPWQLARIALTYPFRRAASLVQLLDRADDTLARWDMLTDRRRVVAVAASDAHSRIALARAEPYRQRFWIATPGYEPMFRAFSIALSHVTLEGAADADARAVIDEIRSGRVYSVVDGIATPSAFAFTATSGRHRATAGELLPLDGPPTFEAALGAPDDARIVLLRNGHRVFESRGTLLRYTSEGGPGVFRVEVTLPGAPGRPPVPWILSNPIYVGRTDEIGASRRSPIVQVLPAAMTAAAWTVERSAASLGAVDIRPAINGEQALFRFALAGAESTSPYAAAALATPSTLSQYDRVSFRLRADRPMRVSVQLRAPGGAAGERWHRSLFVDPTPRDISVFFDDMRPRGATRTEHPNLERVQSLLFVVDTVHTRSGTTGQVAIENLRFEQ